MSSENCPFCDLGSRVVASNDLAAAVRDKEPASKGHTLVIPKRHCESFFDLKDEEVRACFTLLGQERARIVAEFHPDGFNIGVNDGSAAGQSIGHTHWHLIPRYHGDHPDPRGGVRHVIPTRR
jgi:diadenosine tetraphosphate (Ap4A) HIT family hydrolase